ncbi:MAG: DUF892 family protein [Sphingobacteriaceae bacterium]|nr:MAG: DUF892 family protein [Sphingobacteriaceae bacterium]
MQQDLRSGTSGSTDDYTKLFTITVSDIYLGKAVLYDYLPLMVSRATNQELKRTILNVAISISAQLLRLNFILAILRQILLNHTPLVREMADLPAYLERDLLDISDYSTDVLLLVHLTIVETKEVEAFLLLQKLARKLQNKNITQYLHHNLQDALSSKVALEQLLDSFVR